MSNEMFTREELIQILRTYYKTNKEIPKSTSIKNPNYKTYLKTFGSWEEALKCAGMGKDIIEKGKQYIQKKNTEKQEIINNQINNSNKLDNDLSEVINISKSYFNKIEENGVIIPQEYKDLISESWNEILSLVKIS